MVAAAVAAVLLGAIGAGAYLAGLRMRLAAHEAIVARRTQHAPVAELEARLQAVENRLRGIEAAKLMSR